MRLHSLRVQLLLASTALLVVLIGTTLAWVGYQGNRLVTERLSADLHRAADLIRSSQAERYDSLRITAELLAAFPELHALSQTDAATIRDFLLDYQRRTQRADLLILLTPQGDVQARTDAVATSPLPEVGPRWIVPTLSGNPPNALLETDGGTYQATMAAAEAAGTVFGFLLVGSRVDDATARRLRDTTGDETVILGRTATLGTTIAVAMLPWRSLSELSRSGVTMRSPTGVDIGGERYLAIVAPTADEDRAVFVSLQSRDRAMAPYRRLQFGLVVVGLIGVVAGVVASALLARRITRPLGQLVEGTRQVAAGNYDCELRPSGIDELTTLASSFNDMTRGLRERSDMQKFVSQSTVDMIRATTGSRSGAGERRTLTVLFSDVRGFTTFSETRDPEQVVQMLNACLGVQAERVQKYGGDVDKFVGDCVVALFEGEDMTLRAIRCALDMQKAIETLRADGVPVAVGIGIATGEVVLGSIGGGNRFDYTAVGLHVNVAARLCSMAGPHEILLTESTWHPVSDLVAAERLDPLSVRGLTQPVSVYRMLVPAVATADQGRLPS